MRIHDRSSSGSCRRWTCSRACAGGLHQGQGGNLRADNIAERRGIVEGNDKRRARLSCIDHLLSCVPYGGCHTRTSTCPNVFNPDYERNVLPPNLYVPAKY